MQYEGDTAAVISNRGGGVNDLSCPAMTKKQARRFAGFEHNCHDCVHHEPRSSDLARNDRRRLPHRSAGLTGADGKMHVSDTAVNYARRPHPYTAASGYAAASSI